MSIDLKEPVKRMTQDKPEAPAPRKFLFDRSFDDAAVVHRAPERKPILMKPEQIEGLKKEGYDAGYQAGLEAVHASQEKRNGEFLQVIDNRLANLIEEAARLQQEMQMQARLLAMAAAKKVLPTFTERNGTAEIETMIADALRDMAREPRLVVRIHESQFDMINEKVQAMATQRAYAGKVIVVADAETQPGDCRVEWADGGIERNTQATWQAIENVILPVT